MAMVYQITTWQIMIGQITIWLLSAICVICALSVILHKNPVVSAIYLIGCFFALAGLFLMLQAPFLAAAQIIIYAGAIMVLFIFVIMLLNLKKEPDRFSRAKLFKFPRVVLLFLLLFSFLTSIFATAFPFAPYSGTDKGRSVADVATLLFTKYLFPFELASLLLLIAMIGGIVMAKKRVS